MKEAFRVSKSRIIQARSSSVMEQDSMLIHYRLSRPDQNWIYGNIEQ
jgi:hypothetical protein